MTTPITTTADRLIGLAARDKRVWEQEDHGHLVFDEEGMIIVDADSSDTAAFVAACDPQTITALCSAIKEMAAEHEEDQGVIAVWRRRTSEAEAERDALRSALRQIVVADDSGTLCQEHIEYARRLLENGNG